MTSPDHPCAGSCTCCRGYLVPVCGRDVWLISRKLHLDPAGFVVAWQDDEPDIDGFLIDPDGPRFSLVLDKRSWKRDPSPCIFLLTLPGGHDRCGIYEHRPVACRAYPMVWEGDRVALRGDALCPPDAWSADEPRQPHWRDALQHARMQHDVYHAAVDHWNARLKAPCEFADYYAYVLRAYDALSALDAEIGQPALARLRASWRAPAADQGTPVDALPWQAHLDRVRAVLARL